MRVLHVDSAREWRGGQTQLLALARELPGSEVALPPDAPLRAALEGAGVPTHPVDFSGMWRGARALQRVVQRVRPDVVAAHTSHAHGHAVRVEGAPVVVHRRLDFAPRRLSRWKYARPCGYVAVSTAVARVLEGAGVRRERIRVVHDGVDPLPRADREASRRCLGVPESATLVVTAGALVPHKGHRFLVDALAELPGVQALLAGEGPLRGELEARVARLGLGERVRLVGQLADVSGLLAAADLFVHPSVEEGLGQVVIEAMHAGAPVVATRTGGLVDLVGDGTGWLAEPGSGASLAGAIRRALASPHERARRVERAAAVARSRLSVREMVERTAAAYAELTTECG